MSHLVELIDHPFRYDSHQFRMEHKQLENDIAAFVIAFRKNRKETFAITEYIVDSEEMVRQLNFSSQL